MDCRIQSIIILVVLSKCDPRVGLTIAGTCIVHHHRSYQKATSIMPFELTKYGERKDLWTLTVNGASKEEIKEMVGCFSKVKKDGRVLLVLDPRKMSERQAKGWCVWFAQGGMRCPSAITEMIEGELPSKALKSTVFCSGAPIMGQKEHAQSHSKERDRVHKLDANAGTGAMSGIKDHAADRGILETMGVMGRDADVEPDHKALHVESAGKCADAIKLLEHLQVELANVSGKTCSSALHDGAKAKMLTAFAHGEQPAWKACTEDERATQPVSGVPITPERALCADAEGLHVPAPHRHDEIPQDVRLQGLFDDDESPPRERRERDRRGRDRCGRDRRGRDRRGRDRRNRDDRRRGDDVPPRGEENNERDPPNDEENPPRANVEDGLDPANPPHAEAGDGRDPPNCEENLSDEEEGNDLEEVGEEGEEDGECNPVLDASSLDARLSFDDDDDLSLDTDEDVDVPNDADIHGDEHCQRREEAAEDAANDDLEHVDRVGV